MITENRLIELEIKISRQEDLLESLNQVVYQQQKKIDHLEAICTALAKLIRQAPDEERNPGHEKPPHY